jgi:hypothetical protein
VAACSEGFAVPHPVRFHPALQVCRALPDQSSQLFFPMAGFIRLAVNFFWPINHSSLMLKSMPHGAHGMLCSHCVRGGGGGMENGQKVFFVDLKLFAPIQAWSPPPPPPSPPHIHGVSQ